MRNRLWLNLPDALASRQPVVLFDGECTLCSTSVRFLIRHDTSGKLNFASLQSETGLEVLKLAGKDHQQNDTLLLIEENILYSYSTAAIKIASHLKFPWRLLGIFRIVPAVISDLFYRIISKNRYTWFGRESLCMTDIENYQQRFLS